MVNNPLPELSNKWFYAIFEMNRMLHQMETFMAKAVPDGVTQGTGVPLAALPLRGTVKAPRFAMRCLLRGDAVVHLLRASHSPALKRAVESRSWTSPSGLKGEIFSECFKIMSNTFGVFMEKTGIYNTSLS